MYILRHVHEVAIDYQSVMSKLPECLPFSYIQSCMEYTSEEMGDMHFVYVRASVNLNFAR